MEAHRPEPNMPKSPLRILNEFRELKDFAAESEKFLYFNYDRENVLKWSGVLVPATEPYNENAYEVQIELPHVYPKEPPKLTFRTKIFHPNVSALGVVKMEIITKKEWLPSMRMGDVIEALIDIIENPNAENEQIVANEACAKLYIDDNAEFLRKAKEYARKNGLTPPKPMTVRKQPRQVKPKTTKKITFKDNSKKSNSGRFIDVERLLKLTYDGISMRRSP